ncbi:MAG: NAD-dependent protein deacetylase [Pseudomonadales bacterium]|nr:NAD-dependent protein deacetylase [Pseudomonadales bacterium]
MPTQDIDPNNDDFERLQRFILTRNNMLVITGAGISTASGIGDYRNQAGQWKRPKPVTHQDFMGHLSWRQRYWARSQLGYPSFLQAAPNRAHRALTRLECQGQLCGLVTQNVDRLHQQAGHQEVVDLHGRLDQVICMDCGVIVPRRDVQAWLEERNPHLQNQSFEPAPDGDADMEMDFSSVEVPHCSACGGILKPHVVFYGDSVERSIVNVINSKVEGADGVLVVGSSLMVFSSYRFIRHAHASGVPVAALNQGVTRADDMFTLKVEAPADWLDTMVKV